MASTLEQFVINIRKPYLQGNYNDVLQVVKKSGEILTRNSAHLDNVLETLQVEEHSMAVMACLIAKFKTIEVHQDMFELLMAQVSDFITNCNVNEIQLARENFAELCHLMTQYLVVRNCPMRGIELLRRAIAKLQAKPDQLTAVHCDLCQLCLKAMCFKPALPYLEMDIGSICLSKANDPTSFDVKDFLLYYYYGGMIFTALKRYEEALFMFEVAVTVPARSLSSIMVEAYKKYILVSLIHHGRVNTLPKWTSQVVFRSVKLSSFAYHELANAFNTNSTDLARRVIAQHTALFKKEKNLGLANQVLSNLFKNKIQRLTKTFLTLSLADVASRVQLQSADEAEKYILNMIEDNEIFATVNKKDGMVIFHDDSEKYNSPEMLKTLEEQITSCIELDRQIKQMEEEITLNPIFVHKCSSQDEDASSKLCPYSM